MVPLTWSWAPAGGAGGGRRPYPGTVRGRSAYAWQVDEGQAPGEDPFRELLDPGFVERATVREPTAAERGVAARQAAVASHPASAPDPLRTVPTAPRPLPTPPRRRRRRGRSLVALLLLAVVAGAGYAAYRQWPAIAGTGVVPVPDEIAGPSEPIKHRPSNWPPTPPETSSEPLGVPADTASAGPHAFAATQDDGATAVAWDPCRPVPYVVRPGGPAGSDLLLRQAIDRVSIATGLRFVDQGTTDEVPGPARAPYQPERYGDRWAPVLIAWSNPGEYPILGGREENGAGVTDVAGVGGASSAGWEGEPTVYVTGSLVLDEPDLTAMLAQRDGWDRVRSVIMHELGHVVGLDHVDDPGQLMHATTVPGVVEFGPGDLQGLAALGRGPCAPDV